MSYFTATDIENKIDNITTSNPDICTKITLPNQTFEDKTCHAIKISKGTGPVRKGVLFIAGVHAREWTNPDTSITFIEKLVTAYKNSTGITFGGKSIAVAQIKDIIEKLDTFVFPLVNPDGREYSQTSDIDWRKNRRPNSGAAGCKGVDINRNFDILWNYGFGASVDPCLIDYKGLDKFSEPESKNVKYLLDTYSNIEFFIDLHSYASKILLSWGIEDNQSNKPAMNFSNIDPAWIPFVGKSRYDSLVKGTPAELVYREFIPFLDYDKTYQIAKRMQKAIKDVRGKAYEISQSSELYPTTGASDDYTYSRHFADSTLKKTFAFTIESGTAFQPPEPERTGVIKDICAAMFEFCITILEGIKFQRFVTLTSKKTKKNKINARL